MLLGDAVERGEPFDVALLDYNMPEMVGVELARTIKADPALSNTRLVLLTSSAERGEAQAASSVGFDAHLTKPVRNALLYDTLAAIIGRQGSKSAEVMVTHDSLTEHKARARIHVLVVEDNIVNQKVASRMLDKLGYRFDVASNGVEALEAVTRNLYAAVLMDCQMPEMDGFEATRRIRALEGRTGGIPIIAMTAGAMKRDEDKARAAGMDDYIAKPVKLENLSAALERWTKQPATKGSGSDAEPVSTLEAAVDAAVLDSLKRLDEDSEKGEPGKLVSAFLENANALLEELREDVLEEDGERISLRAHSLKGSVATLGAKRMAALCRSMEDLLSSGELVRAHGLLARIEGEFDRVCMEVQADARSLEGETRRG